jgi:hypothetical protein
MTLLKIAMAIAVIVELFSIIGSLIPTNNELSENVVLSGEITPNSIIIITLPISYLIFLFLALRAIKKDEELIRSVDRIR